MNDNTPRGTSRRKALSIFLATTALAAAGGAAYEAGLFGPHYPRTPYDDLLASLPDREAAMTIGKALRAGDPAFDAKTAAAQLRERLKEQSLSHLVIADIDDNNLTEVKGWVLPTSIAQLSALAAP